MSQTIQDTTAEGTTCSAPSIVLPENAVTPDVEIDKNLVNRYCIIQLPIMINCTVIPDAVFLKYCFKMYIVLKYYCCVSISN